MSKRLRYLFAVLLAGAVMGLLAPVSGLSPASGQEIEVFIAPGAESYVFERAWGSLGNLNDEFSSPEGVAVDRTGKAVYVADRDNHRISKFNANGDFLLNWGAFGSVDGQFNGPHDIAVDKSSNVWVADTNNNKVQKFSSSGQHLCSAGGLTNPHGIGIDPKTGTVLVANTGAHAIRKLSSACADMGGFGSQGSGDGQYQSPHDVAVDMQGNVYVADSNNYRIQKLTQAGTFLAKWGVFGSGDSRYAGPQFYTPSGISVDGCGGVYVSDSNNRRIQKYTTGGVFITSWGWIGSGNGQFAYPVGVAVDLAGKVYVADTNAHRIEKFAPSPSDRTHLFKNKWGTQGGLDGQFQSPHGVAVDPATGNVYVIDTNNHRVQQFSGAGTFIRKWGSFGSTDGLFSTPHGIAVDPVNGDVYVADTNNHRVQKFNASGTFITKWGFFGTGNGQFNAPHGVAVDPVSRNVWVADFSNNRVQKFTQTGTFVRGIGNGITWTGSPPAPQAGNMNSWFNGAAGVAVDASQNLYAMDYNNHRVEKFDTNGNFLTKWGPFGSGNGQFYSPVGAAVDAGGTLYVLDQNNHRVQRFAANGRFITKWGNNGALNGLFSSPEGVAVKDNLIYVADDGNHRIQVFERFGFTSAATPTSLTITRGQTANFTMQVTGGEPNTLGTTASFCILAGTPNATTVSFTPSSVTPGTNLVTSTLALVTTVATKTKKYVIYIQTLGGGQTRVVSVTLTVNP